MCAEIIIHSNDERGAMRLTEIFKTYNKLQCWNGCVQLEIFAHDW